MFPRIPHYPTKLGSDDTLGICHLTCAGLIGTVSPESAELQQNSVLFKIMGTKPVTNPSGIKECQECTLAN
jgi:hypothetical protein